MNFPIVLIHFSPRVDSLSTMDKLAGPNVSFIERFHCIIKVIAIQLSELGHGWWQ